MGNKMATRTKKTKKDNSLDIETVIPGGYMDTYNDLIDNEHEGLVGVLEEFTQPGLVRTYGEHFFNSVYYLQVQETYSGLYEFTIDTFKQGGEKITKKIKKFTRELAWFQMIDSFDKHPNMIDAADNKLLPHYFFNQKKYLIGCICMLKGDLVKSLKTK